MATSLLDHLRSLFTSSAVSDLARTMGEDTAPAQKAADGLIPAITSGVINRASSNEGAATLYRLLQSTPFDTDPSINQLVETGDHRQKAAASGNALLKQLFPADVDRLTEATATYSGVSQGSAATLTGLVMSVLMGFLHKQITTNSLTEPQFAAMLRGEAAGVRSAVPTAFAALLGWFLGTAPVAATTTVRSETVVPAKDDQGTPWWRWLLYALGLLLLILLLMRTCRNKTDKTTTTTAVATDTIASATGPAAGTSATTAGPEVRVGVDLPGGRRLNVVENSFNYNLAKYVADKSRKANRIFTFDNLTFDTDSATITAEAQPNVNDLIEIMKAYPTMTIRVEGNTDNTGDEAINDPLSDARAEAVKKALVAAGIDASRVTTRGLGSEKPVTTNKTATGREKNRRIDVVITKV